MSLPSVEKNTRQRALCRVLYFWHSPNKLFAECKKNTRQRNSLLSVKNKTLGKDLLRQVFSFTDGFFVWHSTKSFFTKCLKKHSAKYLALDKKTNSGSASKHSFIAPFIIILPYLFILLYRSLTLLYIWTNARNSWHNIMYGLHVINNQPKNKIAYIS